MREYDLATVCKWIGNSPAVAARHYAMSVDLNADFARATGRNQAQQKAQQSGADGERQETTFSARNACPEALWTTSGNRGPIDVTHYRTMEWALQDQNSIKKPRETRDFFNQPVRIPVQSLRGRRKTLAMMKVSLSCFKSGPRYQPTFAGRS